MLLLAAEEIGHHSATGFPLLTALIAVPALAAVIVALLPRQRVDVIRLAGVLGSLAALVLSGYLAVRFRSGQADYQFVTDHQWIESLGIHWKLGVDGISLWLVVLTGVLFPIALIGPVVHDNVKSYVAWLLVLEAACMGTFLAIDLFVFFVFFEIVLVPMYFLIAGWGHGRREYAAMKFFLYTLAGSAFLLVGMLALVVLHAQDNPLTFDLVTLASDPVTGSTARWLFLAFAVAFAVKTPLFPLHTWLPDAHTEAPTAGSVILAGVLLKMGTYGLLRFGLELFPQAAVDLAPWLLTLSVIGIIYGAIVAAVQSDLKRLVAYSSVAHLGFIVLGTFALDEPRAVGRSHPNGQPRHLDGRVVPARRDDLRAPPHARHRRARRAPASGAGDGGGVHRRHAELDRPARPQRVRRRVPRAARNLQRAPLVGRRRHAGRRARRRLPALGLSARLPR